MPRTTEAIDQPPEIHNGPSTLKTTATAADGHLFKAATKKKRRLRMSTTEQLRGASLIMFFVATRCESYGIVLWMLASVAAMILAEKRLPK